MGKKTLILLSFSLLFLAPSLVMSDCTDFTRMTGWAVLGSHSIIFFAGNSPLATVNLQSCTLDSSSDIRVMKRYVCDSDSIIVNGHECAIMSLNLI